MLWVQLDAISVNILIELMFDTRMVSIEVLELYGLVE